MNKTESRFNNTSPVYICPWCNTHLKYTEEFDTDTGCFYLVARCLNCLNKNENEKCNCYSMNYTGIICKKHANTFKVDISFKIFNKYHICVPNDLSREKQLSNSIRVSKFVRDFSKNTCNKHLMFPKNGLIITDLYLNHDTGIQINNFIQNSVQEIINNTIPKMVLAYHVLVNYSTLLPELIEYMLQLMLGKEFYGIIPIESINTVYKSIIASMNLAKQLAL